MSSAPVSSSLDFGQFAGLRAAAQKNGGQDEATLRKVAQQFEGLFTSMLLKSMRAGLPGDTTLGSQGEMYQGMFDQQLATTLSSGKGMGLADMLVQQLTQSRAMAVNPPAADEVAALQSPVSVGDDWQPKNAQDFIETIQPHAEKAAKELGVPAKAIIAQAAVETGWGRHLPRHADGTPSFNLFGIKAGSKWQGERLNKSTQEFRNGEMKSETASFRSYGSLDEAFGDYVSFLKQNPRYTQALRADSVHEFATGLQKAGYATDPAYAQKLVGVANGREMQSAYAKGQAV